MKPPLMPAATCRTLLQPDVMFPDRLDRRGAIVAKAVCRDCPVKQDCLEMALAEREHFGVWGGTTEVERKSILDARTTLAREARQAVAHA